MKQYLLILVIQLIISTGVTAQDDLIFVFLSTNPNREELSEQKVAELQKAHMENIGKLASENKLLIAGPFIGGGGIFVLRTSSEDQAMEWLNTDEAIRAGRYNLELFSYKPFIGSVCAVGENYEMVQYNFIRFVPNLTKFNIQQESDLMKAHQDFIRRLDQTGNVIAAGDLGTRAGGILIMDGDLQKEVIESDPAVQGTLMELEFKKLYIAKGSFCEEKN